MTWSVVLHHNGQPATGHIPCNPWDIATHIATHIANAVHDKGETA